MTSRRQFVQSAIGLTGVTFAGALGVRAEQSGVQPTTADNGEAAVLPKPERRDYCSKPFQVAVAFGESTTAGGTATAREFTWVNRLTDLINEVQLQPVKMINNGIGGNVVSPRSPTWARNGKPSAMERYKKHVIEPRPQLVLVSYGLNDARGGTPLAHFLEDLRHIVLDIKNQTGAVVVLMSAYFMTEFYRHSPDNKGTIATFIGFNTGIKRLAEECDTLFADAWEAEGMAPWMLDLDAVHANNLGHRVIANRVFEVLAQNCSCLSERAFELRKTFKPWRDESMLKKSILGP